MGSLFFLSIPYSYYQGMKIVRPFSVMSVTVAHFLFPKSIEWLLSPTIGAIMWCNMSCSKNQSLFSHTWSCKARIHDRVPPTGIVFFKDVMTVTVGMLTKDQSIIKNLIANGCTSDSN